VEGYATGKTNKTKQVGQEVGGGYFVGGSDFEGKKKEKRRNSSLMKGTLRKQMRRLGIWTHGGGKKKTSSLIRGVTAPQAEKGLREKREKEMT